MMKYLCRDHMMAGLEPVWRNTDQAVIVRLTF